MSEDGLLEGLDEPNMEIQIDTLMGTSFDMRVSSGDTVRDIKQRIQRVEGIPIHQQNLIFQSAELKDSWRLGDAGVRNGAVIKLVVAMKGGPISTRRLAMSCEHHLMLKELKELLENTRDEIGDKLTHGSKVSVLVFKEGDILNLLRVIENEDGSYSPYTEKPISPPNRPHPKPTRRAIFAKLIENSDMMLKMSNLRKRMEDVTIKRQLRTGDPPRSDPPSKVPDLQYKLFSECNDLLLDTIDMKVLEKSAVDEDDDSHSDTEEVALKDKHRIKAHRRTGGGLKSLYSQSQGAFSHTKQNYARIHKKTRDLRAGEGSSKDPDVCVPLAVPKRMTRLLLTDGVSDTPKRSPELEGNADVWEIHETDRLKHSATCKFGMVKRRQSLDYGYEGLDSAKAPDLAEFNYGEVCSGNYFHVPQFVAAASSPSAIPPQYAPKQEDICDFYFRNDTRSPLYGRKSRAGDLERSSIERLKNDSLLSEENSIDDLYGYYNLGCVEGAAKEVLPPVVKKKSRCSECNKRLNITNIYDCRCGKIFCSQHRYSEVHRCSYDYKTEGRKILEHQNPLVTAEKVNRL